MNGARLTEWIGIRVEELVDFGVQREDAEALMRWVRNGAIASEAESRNENQFLLDFKRHGSTTLAKMAGTSPQAIRAKRTRLLNRKRELREGLREA